MSITLTDAATGVEIVVGFDKAYKVRTVAAEAGKSSTEFVVFYTNGGIRSVKVRETVEEVEEMLRNSVRGSKLPKT